MMMTEIYEHNPTHNLLWCGADIFDSVDQRNPNYPEKIQIEFNNYFL